LNIPVFKFSDINIEESIKVGVLKIDVEGAELEVLESFTEVIKRDSPLIMVEILPAYDIKNSNRIVRQNKIRELLINNHYSIFRILKKNDEFKDIQNIPAFEIHSDLNLCDYILVPDEKVERLIALLGNIKKGI
jgi:hypothetical protein